MTNKPLPVQHTKLRCFGNFDNMSHACQVCIDWEECMGVKSSSSPMKMNGVEIAKAQDFHTWNAKIRIYNYHGSHQCQIQIPIGIIKFLKLKNKDKIQIAIRREDVKE